MSRVGPMWPAGNTLIEFYIRKSYKLQFISIYIFLNQILGENQYGESILELGFAFKIQYLESCLRFELLVCTTRFCGLSTH